MSARPRRPTLADVARSAGTSATVVSYVVNGGPRPVSETTAARVRDAIDRLGYRPNTTARALAVGSTKTIGLVVPDSTNPFFADGAILVSNTISNATISNAGNPSSTLADFEPDFDSMINLDALGSFDETGYGVMQSESGGFALDMDWMQGVGGTDGLGSDGMGDVMV